jgi:hypothetical protein
MAKGWGSTSALERFPVTMGGGVAVKLGCQERQHTSHAYGGDEVQVLMLISAAGSGPQGHVDFDVLGGRLESMAASITHEFTKFIKCAQFFLHGSSVHGKQLDSVGSGEPLEV